MAEQSLFLDARQPGTPDALRAASVLQVEVIRGEQDVLGLEGAWRSLYLRNYADSPFCRYEWFQAWWEHFGSRLEAGALSANLLAITITQGDRVVAIACFYFCTYPHWSPQVRCLRPVGVLGYRHSDLTEEPILLIERDLESEILPILIAKLEELKSEFDLVQFHYIAENETKPEIPCRRTMLWKRGRWHESTGMLSLSLPGSWEEFLQGQSAKSQEHIKRKPRALAKRCENWGVEMASLEQTEEAVEELIRLHRIRNDAAKGRTIHIVSKEHRLFYREYMKRVVADGLGGVMVLRADGKVIAAQSVLFGEREWLLYHQGHDPEYAQVSPLVILQTECYRLAIVAGVSKIRLHRFAQEWKLRWGAEPDGFFDQWMAIRRAPLSLVRTALYSMNQTSLDVPEETPL